MSGFEKYVEQAADEIQRVVFGTVARTLTGEREGCTEAARAVLAAVGPLIEEDTRDRMVTAAGKALERDGGPVHKPFPDDGVTYCGWSTGTQVIEGCGETWPCSTVRARGIATKATTS